MSKTINAQPFDIHSTQGDVVQLRDYTGDKDTLSYKRTAPKRVKDFPGMAKSELKLTRIDPATGELVGIITVATSIRADSIATDRSQMMTLAKAATVDAAWADLVNDQRLPLNVSA
jgi:hypothetical protein